jgi:hypothetical protein
MIRSSKESSKRDTFGILEVSFRQRSSLPCKNKSAKYNVCLSLIWILHFIFLEKIVIFVFLQHFGAGSVGLGCLFTHKTQAFLVLDQFENIFLSSARDATID